MNRVRSRLKTTLKLGVSNVLDVAAYRVQLKAGTHRVQRIKPKRVPDDVFFTASDESVTDTDSVPLEYFGWHAVAWT
jgi:hypothetical protein